MLHGGHRLEEWKLLHTCTALLYCVWARENALEGGDVVSCVFPANKRVLANDFLSSTPAGVAKRVHVRCPEEKGSLPARGESTAALRVETASLVAHSGPDRAPKRAIPASAHRDDLRERGRATSRDVLPRKRDFCTAARAHPMQSFAEDVDGDGEARHAKVVRVHVRCLFLQRHRSDQCGGAHLRRLCCVAPRHVGVGATSDNFEIGARRCCVERKARGALEIDVAAARCAVRSNRSVRRVHRPGQRLTAVVIVLIARRQYD